MTRRRTPAEIEELARRAEAGELPTRPLTPEEAARVERIKSGALIVARFGERRELSIEILEEGWRFWTAGRNLCEHRRRADGAEHHALPLVKLRSLAIWLARNWSAIAYGTDARPRGDLAMAGASACQAHGLLARVPAERARTDPWWRRHGIRSADASLPNVFLERQGDEIAVSWDASASAQLVHPIGSDVAFLPVGATVAALRAFLREAPETLGLAGADRDVVAAAVGADAQVGQAIIQEYQPGLDPAWLEQIGVALAELAESGSSRHFVPALLRSARGASVAISELELRQVCEMLRPSVGDSCKRLRQLAKGLEHAAIDPSAPWESGYALAQEVRARLDIPLEETVGVEAILSDVGVDTRDIELADGAIRGMAVCAMGLTPTAFVNTRSQDAEGLSGRRTTLAHELCHFIFDRDRMVSLGMMEVPHASERLIEMRANAFAVEFLVPMANLIHLRHARGEEREVGLREISVKYEVSRAALEPHLRDLIRRTEGL